MNYDGGFMLPSLKKVHFQSHIRIERLNPKRDIRSYLIKQGHLLYYETCWLLTVSARC